MSTKTTVTTVERTEAEVAQCALIVSSCSPSWKMKGIGAVIALPGLGQKRRITDAIDLAHAFKASYFVYAGQNKAEAESMGPKDLEELEEIMSHADRLPIETALLAQIHAHNTPDQAKFIVKECRERGIKSAILTAPGWHLTRAFLTLVRAAEREKIPTKFYAQPVAGTSPLRPMTPDHKTSGYTTLESAASAEVARCIKYRSDVADLEELMAYLRRVDIVS